MPLCVYLECSGPQPFWGCPLQAGPRGGRQPGLFQREEARRPRSEVTGVLGVILGAGNSILWSSHLPTFGQACGQPPVLSRRRVLGQIFHRPVQ